MLRLHLCAPCIWLMLFCASLQAADQLGDPLPNGAIARLGTTRLRHGNMVNQVDINAKGDLLISICSNGDANVWEAKTGKLVRSHEFAEGFTRSAGFMPGGDTYFVVDKKSIFHVYDVKSGEEMRSFPMQLHPQAKPHFAADDRFVVANPFVNEVNIWRLTEEGPKQTFKRAGSYERAIFSPDGKWLAAFGKGLLERIELDGDKVTARLEIEQHEFTSADVSPDGKLIATGSDGVTFAVWNATTGEQIWGREDMKSDNGGAWVAFSPDGETLAVGGYPRLKVSFWNVDTQRLLAEYDEDYSPQVRWFPDGQRVAIWGDRNSVHILNAQTGKYEPDLPGHEFLPRTMVFLADGDKMASATSNDSSLRIWETKSGRQLHVYRFHLAGYATPIPNTTKLIASGRNHLAIYDYESGEAEVLESEDISRMHRHWLTVVSPDGNRMAARVATNRIVIKGGREQQMGGLSLATWDLQTKEKRRTISLVRSPAQAFLQFMPNSEQLVGVTAGGKAIDGEAGDVGPMRAVVWNFSDLSEVRTLASGSINAAALSRDSTLLAIGRGKLPAQIIRVADGKVLHEYDAKQPHDVKSLQFLRDGDWLLCCGADKHFIFDVKTGKILRSIQSPSNVAVASADGKVLAVGERSGRITLWNAESGKQLTEFDGHAEQVSRLVFSPDNHLLASASYDCTILLWDLKPFRDP